MTTKLQCEYCDSIVFLAFNEPDLDNAYYFCRKRCFMLFTTQGKKKK